MQWNMRRDERGVTAIVVGLLATCLIAGVGLSVDTGNYVLQRERLQTGADNAALAIAQDCALRRAACATTAAGSTAKLLVDQNIDGATTELVGSVDPSTKTVTVRANKDVAMNFAAAIGVGPKPANAKAIASWDEAPSEGYPLLPMAVGYCQYKRNAYPATQHITIRTDLVDSAVKSVADIIGWTGLLTALFPSTACQNQSGQTRTMSDGAVWLTSLNTALDIFDKSNMSLCNMKVKLIETMLVTSITPVKVPTSCVNKLKAGTIAMLPVYESISPLTVLSSNITLKIVGFAPFKITGWNMGNGNKQDNSATPACDSISIPLIVTSIQLGCQAIQGYFVRSVVQDPDQVFAYDSKAPDLGGVRLTARLTQ